MKELLINTVLNDEEMKKLRSREDPAFPYLFAIVGDISVKSEYCRSVLLVSEKKIDTYELDSDHFGSSIDISEIASAQNKRMYGNAILRIALKSGETVNVFRYTFSVNALCEAAAGFLVTVSEGGDVDEAYECMKAVYEKQLSVCPKCGRTLSSPRRDLHSLCKQEKGRRQARQIPHTGGTAADILYTARRYNHRIVVDTADADKKSC